MADTGAPHFIPYVEPTDLVREYPAADEASAFAVAAALDAVGNAGIGSNVVQTVKTDTFTTSSGSFTQVTGLTATITPSSGTSRILVLAEVKLSVENFDNAAAHLGLFRGETQVYLGDADGSRVRSAATLSKNTANLQISFSTWGYSILFLDSPATASAVTYGLRLRRGTGRSVFVNRSGLNANDANDGRTASSITLVEVAP